MAEEEKALPQPGSIVRLKGTDRICTLLEVVKHYEETAWEIDWGVLKPPPPATHTAHWPMSQLELVESSTSLA